MTNPTQIDSSFENSDWIKRVDPKAQAADIAAIEEARRLHATELASREPPKVVKEMYEREEGARKKRRGKDSH